MAQINHQKLLKYLDQNSFGQSKGMTESAKIKANSALTQNLAAADLEYYTGKKEEQDSLFNELMTTIDSGTWNTTAELENYLFGENGAGGIASDLSEQQQAQIQQRLDYYKNDPDQKKKEELASDNIVIKDDVTQTGFLTDTEEGNEFYLKIGDEEYAVELGSKAGEKDLPSDINSYVSEGSVFYYNGGMYIRKNNAYYHLLDDWGETSTDDYKAVLNYYKAQPQQQSQ